ncbi:serine hydrolase domain-containing protein [Parasphingopyxis marina]|uniref:Beta-lactamase family protein n=1 Tax=Parasphingopyxis marina TaxID=2761622 RepID=A0A842HXX6_9SPHN|nr:serine hydrolase domain-containing protein [Parasphingopyxis marina]MBC2777303.1 beta-lactamase family protein [Parasphingopyxis marina]
MRHIAIYRLLALTPVAACATTPQEPPASPALARPATAELAPRIDAIMERHGITTGAVGILRDGNLVYEHYTGEEAPGVPADADTRFDVASITKTVAAETFLRLVAAGEADLDEPVYPYWIDPDVADDPRHRLLTPRMILTQRSGFPNWRFFREDGRLTFERDPGSGYGYSGEGFQYLYRAMEEKLGRSFPELAGRYLFAPLGIETATLVVDRSDTADIALGIDAEGERYDPGCRPGFCWPEGSWSAASGLLITLRDYARIMASISAGEGYGPELAAERDRIVTDQGEESVVDCADAPADCPRDQGYGLGFVEVDLGARRTIGHEGGDWSQLTLAYSYLPSRDGLVIFLNVPMEQGIGAMRALVALLDPASPYAIRFEQWLAERETAGGAED